MDDTATHLARNVAAVRRLRNFSQAQLAAAAGLPRSTVTHIESGQGNPSLSNLVRVAGALGVGLDELVSAPRADLLLVRADDVPRQERASGRVSIRKLLPARIHGLEIDRILVQPRSSMRGKPHLSGTKEYLHCLGGQLQVLVAGTMVAVRQGDVLAFAGDQPHSYRNPDQVPAEALSVVVPLPARLAPDRSDD
jgi:transcriptional regulator with XRE-family HTH domain